MPAADAPARAAGLGALLAAAVLAAPGGASAGVGSGGVELARFGDWVLVSAGPGVCQLRHTLLSAQSGAVLLEMLLLPPDPAGASRSAPSPDRGTADRGTADRGTADRSTADTGATNMGALVALRVPLGVSLPDGIAWRHPATPSEAVGLAWQHCDSTLCLAAGRISAAELDRLRAGNHVEVGFRPLPDAAPIRIQVSLRGVTAGWQALRDCAPAP